jgi:hypothetical protein
VGGQTQLQTGTALGMWPLIAAGAIVYLVLTDRNARVFVSYDHSEDVAYRSILEAWDENPRFRFEYDRQSPMKAIRSQNEDVVKRALTPMLKRSTHLLVIVGEKTWSSKFVRWEIERAQAEDVNLRIAAIKLNHRCRLPEPLRRSGCTWAIGFTEENVQRVLEKAKTAR